MATSDNRQADVLVHESLLRLDEGALSALIGAIQDEIIDQFDGFDSRRVSEPEARLIAFGALRRLGLPAGLELALGSLGNDLLAARDFRHPPNPA